MKPSWILDELCAYSDNVECAARFIKSVMPFIGNIEQLESLLLSEVLKGEHQQILRRGVMLLKALRGAD